MTSLRYVTEHYLLMDNTKYCAPRGSLQKSFSDHLIHLSSDESKNVIRFKNHYVITPNIEFKYSKNKYLKNKQGEIGKFVENDFEYNSGTNEKFLNVNEIKKLNDNNTINDSL